MPLDTTPDPLPDSDLEDLQDMFDRAGIEYEEIDADEVQHVVMDRYSESVDTAIRVRSGDGRSGESGCSTVYAFDAQGALIDTWAWTAL
jgi:hypothetical protein